MDLINKINNELYNDNSQQISIEKIQRNCKKKTIITPEKYRMKKIQLLKNLSNPQISEITSKESKINLILDMHGYIMLKLLKKHVKY